MRLTLLLSLATTVAALATGAVVAPASAGTGFPCGASALFAPLADPAGYFPMHSVGSSQTQTVYKASCVHFIEPQLRIVAQNVGDPAATLTVSVQYKDSTGSHDDTIGVLSGYSQMQASPILSFNPSDLHGNITVTLTPSGPLGDWDVDGVYIDPFLAR